MGKDDLEAFKDNGNTWKDSRWRISREAVEMMDEVMIKSINENVGVHDTLWHLGDFSMPGRHQYERMCRHYRALINCKNVNLVWGNHDELCIGDLFSTTLDKRTINVNGQPIVVCHEAFAVWDLSHRGGWNLYGHSHSQAEEWLDRILPGRRSMDVGVDNAYKLLGEFRPFKFEEIKDIMIDRQGVRY